MFTPRGPPGTHEPVILHAFVPRRRLATSREALPSDHSEVFRFPARRASRALNRTCLLGTTCERAAGPSARPLALGDPEVRGILGGSGGKLPDDRRGPFEQVCAVVRRAVPDAEEGKSYGLPALRWKGRPLLGFRAFKDHLSVMPFSAGVVAAVADRLEGFDLSKDSVRFSPEQPIPEDVLLEMFASAPGGAVWRHGIIGGMTAVVDWVVSHTSELGRWEMVHAPPDARLRPHVRGYWGYDERTVAFSRRRELATTDPVLILGFGEPIEVSFPSLGESVRARAFVSGLSDRFAVVDSFGRQQGVQVDLTPLGAFMFLATPMRELANRAVELEALLGREGARLPERLHDAEGWPERFAIVEELLVTRFALAPPGSPDVGWAWRRLRQSGGRVTINELAEELGCSRRHLSARFGEQLGLPPKTVARLLRFGRAARLLGSSQGAQGRPDVRLVEIALECGYYDQAHLNRDFREFAGVTPTELQTMLLPDGGGIAEACSWPETAPQFPSVQASSALRA